MNQLTLPALPTELLHSIAVELSLQDFNSLFQTSQYLNYVLFSNQLELYFKNLITEECPFCDPDKIEFWKLYASQYYKIKHTLRSIEKNEIQLQSSNLDSSDRYLHPNFGNIIGLMNIYTYKDRRTENMNWWSETTLCSSVKPMIYLLDTVGERLMGEKNLLRKQEEEDGSKGKNWGYCIAFDSRECEGKLSELALRPQNFIDRKLLHLDKNNVAWKRTHDVSWNFTIDEHEDKKSITQIQSVYEPSKKWNLNPTIEIGSNNWHEFFPICQEYGDKLYVFRYCPYNRASLICYSNYRLAQDTDENIGNVEWETEMFSFQFDKYFLFFGWFHKMIIHSHYIFTLFHNFNGGKHSYVYVFDRITGEHVGMFDGLEAGFYIEDISVTQDKIFLTTTVGKIRRGEGEHSSGSLQWKPLTAFISQLNLEYYGLFIPKKGPSFSQNKSTQKSIDPCTDNPKTISKLTQKLLKSKDAYRDEWHILHTQQFTEKYPLNTIITEETMIINTWDIPTTIPKNIKVFKPRNITIMIDLLTGDKKYFDQGTNPDGTIIFDDNMNAMFLTRKYLENVGIGSR